MKNIFLKICLFISSFIPLYFLIIVKELTEIINGNLTFNITNSVMLGVNLALIILGTVGIFMSFRQKNLKVVEVVEFKNITHQNFLSYFPIFVLFALAFELEFISMAIVYLLILVMIGVVYIRNEMFFINPLLNILGFRSYEVQIKRGEKIEKTVLFAFNELKSGEFFANDFVLKCKRKATKKNKFRKVMKNR